MRIFTLQCFPLSSHTLNKIKTNNHGTNSPPLISLDLQSQSLQNSMTNFSLRIIQIMDIIYIYTHTYNIKRPSTKTKVYVAF